MIQGFISKGPAKAVVASAATQFHSQDPSLSTESSEVKKHLHVFLCQGGAGSCPSRTSYPKTCHGFPNCPASAGLA